ncbi:MAG: succinate--CoA ligase subunit alpha, partial [Microcystaceae cyanobacterium]
IQGITEPLGSHYAARMKAYGTNIVAGVSAGQGSQQIDEIPLFNLVEEAIAAIGAIETTLIFVEPYAVLDAALEAIASEIGQIIIISRGVPPLDMVRLLKKAQSTNTFVLGSGSQGLIVPEKFWLGISEPQFYIPGEVGIISRTDNLGDEIALSLTQAGCGQSMAISLGTDGIIGTTFEQWLQILEEDDTTEAIVLIGQPSGSAEVKAAEYIAEAIEKPVIAYIAGLHSPVERSFGDAATIITNQLSYSAPTNNTNKQTLAAFKQAKISLAKRPSEIPDLVKKALEK